MNTYSVGLCTRSMHTGGPCNGLPRDDCPTLGETPKEVRDRYATQSAPEVVSCDEARACVNGIVKDAGWVAHGYQPVLLRFIDQAEELEDTLRITMRANTNALEENARLHERLAEALAAIPQGVK